MFVCIDVAHPHHALFYGAIGKELERRGHRIEVFARDKDVTAALLRRQELPHSVISHKGRDGRLADIQEGLRRVHVMYGALRARRPDLMLSSNPTGVIAARLARVPSVFDTMDGKGHGMHYRIPAALCDLMTASELLGLHHSRLVTYPGIMQMAHVPVASDDKQLRQDLALNQQSRIAVLRVSAYTASHDRGKSGLGGELMKDILAWLNRSFDRVLVSSEDEAIIRSSPWLRENPERFIELLSAADLVVGDSVTVAAEAAIAGTPSIWISEFVGSRPIAEQLERRYQVTRNIRLRGEVGTFKDFVASAEELLSDRGRERFSEGRQQLLGQNQMASWYADLVESSERGLSGANSRSADL